MRKMYFTQFFALLGTLCVAFAGAPAAAGRRQAGQSRPAAPAAAEARKPATAQGNAAPKGEEAAAWRLNVRKGAPAQVSLKAKDAPLREIAGELSRKLDAPVFLSSVMQRQRVSHEFSDIPLEGAVRILAPQPYIDYEVSGDPATHPRPIGIYLHALNEPPPDPTAVVKGESESLLIQGHTEEGTDGYEKARENDDLPLRVKSEKSLLSVRARRQPLVVVLAEIASKVDIPFEMKYESSDLVDVDFNSYPIDQAVRTLSPNIRLYMRTDLTSYENRPLRLVLMPPTSSQQLPACEEAGTHLTKQQTNPTGPRPAQQQYESSDKGAPVVEKKPFVEPSVSVPTDVLEATALFQGPTIQAAVVPTLAP